MQILLQISALIAGTLAVWTFWRTAKVRRAEWLSTLHSKFYESDKYKEIRRILDYDSEPELKKLREAIESGADNDLVEKLVDYLNFFEFVAALCQLGQLRTTEVKMLFQYYLSLLCKHEFVRNFIRQEDFENLDLLLTVCVSVKPR